MEPPLVSIIVPTFKRPKLLALTLQSIEKQTFQNFEIFVVDDGSPGTEAKDVCALFQKVFYFKIENTGGPSAPRNFAIRKCRGKYIAFVDDDDLWLPEKLEKQVAILEKYSDFGLVHGPCEVIEQSGKKTGETIGRPGRPDVKHGDVKLRMAGNWTLMTPTVMIRKQVLEKVGSFNETMPPAGEDTEFWTRCSFYTKFYYFDEPLVQYRRHSRNISSNNKMYLHLPLYLFAFIVEEKEKKIIDKSEFKKLQYYLVHMQLKQFSSSKMITLNNVMKIDPSWFIHLNSIKLLIKKILK